MPRGIRADITVCVDVGYYHFQSEKWIGGLCAQVPERFRFGFKVTDEITFKKLPNLPRFGSRAGTANSNFLNPELFEHQFLNPPEPHRQKIGPLIFEFSKFHKADFEEGRDFVAALNQFLGARRTQLLPSGVVSPAPHPESPRAAYNFAASISQKHWCDGKGRHRRVC